MTEKFLSRFQRITSSTNFIPQIDGLRCLAIFAVFSYHLRAYTALKTGTPYISPPEADPLGRLTHLGGFGVPLFFSLSGFILALPFARASFEDRPFPLKPYFWRRVTRLEPPYIVIMALLFVLLILVKGDEASSLFPHLLAGFGYVHNIIYWEPNPINVVAWSLEIEVQFYLLMPVFALVFRVRSTFGRRISMVLVALLFVFGQPLLRRPSGVLSISLLNFGQYFFVGLLLADLYLKDWKGRTVVSYAWDTLGCISWLLLIVSVSSPISAQYIVPMLLCVALASVFRGAVLSRIFGNRWITTIGGMCYTIYFNTLSGHLF